MKKVTHIAALLCILMSAIMLPHQTGILTYFYYTKYLSKTTYVLSLLDKHNYCYKPCNCINQTECVQIDSTLFFHQKVKLCIRKMIHTGSLKPILLLLQEVN